MAIGAGILYSVNFVPLKLHIQNLNKEIDSELSETLRYSFSTLFGVFLTALFIFILYLALLGEKAKLLESKAWLPALLCGSIWAIASLSA